MVTLSNRDDLTLDSVYGIVTYLRPTRLIVAISIAEPIIENCSTNSLYLLLIVGNFGSVLSNTLICDTLTLDKGTCVLMLSRTSSRSRSKGTV